MYVTFVLIFFQKGSLDVSRQADGNIEINEFPHEVDQE